MADDVNVSGRIWMDSFPGWSWYRDDGTAWVKWGHLNEFTEPDQSLFSWVNQSSATIDTTYGPTVLKAPAPGGAGENVNLRVQATPTTPYNTIIGFIPQLDPADNTSCGMILRESSTGKFIYSRLLFDDASAITKSDIVFSVDKYTNPTTFSANYNVASAGFLRGSIIWLKVFDDGINITWSYSNDGQNYIDITTQSRTNFLASGPDQIGFAIDSNTTSGAVGMTLLAWN
jgi:hypothetical protein